jgi:tetratricopeptide (TPR) repeat protein
MLSRHFVSGLGAAAMLTALSSQTPARAAEPESEATVHEAAKHFERGVALYGETDYRSALVEFKRAGALSPNAAVFYNIAETEYQLHDYASALKTFERYLLVAGPTENHRQEVEGNLKTLRSRIGRLTVATVPTGADIAVDDQPAGRTPLDQPLTVNPGHLKIVASISGRAAATRYVEVAAEDNAAVTIDLSETSTPVEEPVVRASISASTAPSTPEVATPPGHSVLRPAGWVVAGTAAAGAVVFGLLARREAKDLKDARDTFGVSPSRLQDLGDRTTSYAIIADALAATAVVVGLITFFSSSGSGSQPETNSSRIGIGPGSVRFQTAF